MQTTVKVASMNQRIPAFLLDCITFFGIASLLLHLTTSLMSDGDNLLETLQDIGWQMRAVVMLSIYFFSWFMVFVIPAGRKGQTFGMRILKCKLYDYDTLSTHPKMSQLLIRELFSISLFLPPFAVFIIASTFMDRSHRNILDKWSKSILISIRKEDLSSTASF